MAGITDGTFCRGLLNHGFDMITLGGYNADPPTVRAGLEILARGRLEFDINEEELVEHIDKQTRLIKDQDFWFCRQNPSNGNPPLLTAGKAKRRFGADRLKVEADGFNRPADIFGNFSFG